MILEVCVDSLESAKKSKRAGATQVELISLASVGGITPSYGLVKKVLDEGIKVMAMIRPRAAGFFYSDDDKSVMLEDIKAFRDMGVQGIVIGALNEDKTLDIEFLKKVVEESRDMEKVFHRAFDVVDDKLNKARELKRIGFDRILTKCGNTLEEGKKELVELIKSGDIEIICGGIRENTLDLAYEIGIKNFHISSNKKIVDRSTENSGIYFGATNSKEDEIYTVADEDYLIKIIEKIKGGNYGL